MCKARAPSCYWDGMCSDRTRPAPPRIRSGQPLLSAVIALALLASCSAPIIRQSDGMDASIAKDSSSEAATDAALDGGSLRSILDRLYGDLRRKRADNADSTCQWCESANGFSALGRRSRDDCVLEERTPPPESKSARDCRIDAFSLDSEAAQSLLERSLNIENEWATCLGSNGTCDFDKYTNCVTYYQADIARLPRLSKAAQEALAACPQDAPPLGPDGGLRCDQEPPLICRSVDVAVVTLPPCCIGSECGLDMDVVVDLTGGPWRGCNQVARPGVASPSCSLALDRFDDGLPEKEDDGFLTVSSTTVLFTFPGCCTPGGRCGALSDEPGASSAIEVKLGLGCIPLQDLTIDWNGGVQPVIPCDPNDGKVIHVDAGVSDAGVFDAGGSDAGV